MDRHIQWGRPDTVNSYWFSKKWVRRKWFHLSPMDIIDEVTALLLVSHSKTNFSVAIYSFVGYDLLLEQRFTKFVAQK